MWYSVYILRSLRDGRLYVGHTDNLDRRVGEHNAGQGGKFTRPRGPWKLVYAEQHPSRSEAMRRECFLKSVQGSREKKRLAQSGA